MNRKVTIYIIFLGLIIALIILAESIRPKPIDWRPTYKLSDKIPLGLYVMDKESAKLFGDNKVKKFSITPYEYFEPLYDYDNSKYGAKGTFINIDEENRIDEESLKELMYFAEHGNTIFLSMKKLPQTLLDTLNITASTSFYYRDSILLSFNTNRLKDRKQYFSEGINFYHFDSLAPNSSVLGYQEIDTLKEANFVKVPFGAGNFILHTQPAVFSNFHLLAADHYKYTEGVISYLPEGNIYWHAKSYDGEGIEGSSLRYILKQPALKWAYYLSLIGFLIFFIFNARRKQRVVPEIPPVKNTTIDFTKTIGNLYFQEKDHHTIIEKKIIYFLEHIRTVYLIDTYSLDDEFIDKLHQKTGKPIEDIEKTVSLIKKHRHNFQSTEADVVEVNKAIENLRL